MSRLHEWRTVSSLIRALLHSVQQPNAGGDKDLAYKHDVLADIDPTT